jgi:DNA topoisomerase-2
MIVDKTLHISNRKKADIVHELRQLRFTPVLKVSKTRKTDDGEPLVEDLEALAAVHDEEEETGASSDFDYLLSMGIWSLTAEKATLIIPSNVAL